MNKPYKLYISDKDNAPTLALIAGSVEGMYRWQPYLKQLQEHFNVFVVDNPGVGLAKAENSFTIEILAERYHEYLQDCGVKSYYLLGHSLGSFIAQKMAHNNPNAVKKIVLISSSIGSFNHEGIIDFVINMPKIDPMRSFFGELYSDLQYKKFIENELKYTGTHVTMASRFAFAMASTKFTSVSYIQEIDQPTLLIHGKQDNLLDFENALQLASLLPNNRLLALDKIGHIPVLEQDNLFDDIIKYLNGEKIGIKIEKNFKLTNDLLEFDKTFITNTNSKKFKNLLAMTLAGIGSTEKRLAKFNTFLASKPKESLFKRIINKLKGYKND